MCWCPSDWMTLSGPTLALLRSSLLSGGCGCPWSERFGVSQGSWGPRPGLSLLHSFGVKEGMGSQAVVGSSEQSECLSDISLCLFSNYKINTQCKKKKRKRIYQWQKYTKGGRSPAPVSLRGEFWPLITVSLNCQDACIHFIIMTLFILFRFLNNFIFKFFFCMWS